MSTDLLSARAMVPFLLAKTDSGVNKMPVLHVDARVLPSEVNAQFHPPAEAYPPGLISSG
jgi:hypothetical protein